MTDEPPLAPPPFTELALTVHQRNQIEERLAAEFDLTPDAARTWVDVTARRGACYGRVVGGTVRDALTAGGRVAASFAAEPLPLVRDDRCLSVVMLQSCYVHPDFRGLGYGLDRSDVEALRRRFAAEAVVLTLFDDGLIPYWRRCGFEVVQHAEVVTLAKLLVRSSRAFAPVPDAGAVAAKLAEVTADGALVSDEDGLVLVRYPGDPIVDEVIVRRGDRVRRTPGVEERTRDGAVPVRLKTVMASPGSLEIVCALDL